MRMIAERIGSDPGRASQEVSADMAEGRSRLMFLSGRRMTGDLDLRLRVELVLGSGSKSSSTAQIVHVRA